MLKLKDIRNWLKELNASENFGIKNFYVGKLDNKKEYSLGVYNYKHGNVDDIFNVGQLRQFNLLNVTILLHISEDFNETEDISNNIFNYFKNLMYSDLFKINEKDIYFIRLLTDNEDIGTDDNGVYERVISIQFCYE
jgi:hypothetical protein